MCVEVFRLEKQCENAVLNAFRIIMFDEETGPLMMPIKIVVCLDPS